MCHWPVAGVNSHCVTDRRKDRPTERLNESFAERDFVGGIKVIIKREDKWLLKEMYKSNLIDENLSIIQ